MPKNSIFIINNHYLDPTGEKLSVGGVETYIFNLCRLMSEIGLNPEVFQLSKVPFNKEYDNVLVHGLCVKRRMFVKKALSLIPKNEIVIFGNDEIVYGKYCGTVVNIQHGIGWDFQRHLYRGELFERLYRLLSIKDDFRRIKYTKLADYVVCVDYNFVNWYRTQVNYSKTNLRVIPNFTKSFEFCPEKPSNRINVIFARRFMTYRGTRIFTYAIRELLPKYHNLYVTFAGSGPDEKWIKEQLKGFNRVEFITYFSDESLLVHKDKHIAVVPSVGSEGTSLSLLEAMASGCSVICSDVGGMTNIILDHYNGLIIDPTSESLTNALKELIDDEDLRMQLSKRAFDTATCAFSRKRWAESWKQLLLEIINSNKGKSNEE